MSDSPQDEVLARALALDRAARAGFLDEVCSGDPALRSELESLLSVADRFPSKVDQTKTADPPSPPLPDHIGRYPIVGVVGAGGMGLVYRAVDPSLEREVALKRLPTGIQADSAQLARFRREARVLARLSHPNIATVYSLESESDEPFLTMELVPGRTLHAVLEDGPLPVERALRIGVRIATAMEAAHAEGVVHRDLKPLNIQVAEMDEVKVLDFGLAKALDEPPAGVVDPAEEADSSDGTGVPTAATFGPMTEVGRIMGTPGYISPEQVRGGTVGPPADVWAFGCILFECLTGASPYRDQATGVRVPTRFRRSADALHLDPDWSMLPEDLPADVDDLLRSCLHGDPEARPDAGAVRGRLEHALERRAAPSLAAHLFSLRGAVVAACLLAAIIGAAVLGLRSRPAAVGLPASTVRQLTFHGGVMAFDLSPDGETVAYLDEKSRLAYLDVRTGESTTAPLTTGAANDTITLVGARASGLRWSPTGRELSVIGIRQAPHAKTATYVVARGEHRASPLGGDDFAGTSWSPDGTRMAGTHGVGKETALCIVDRADGRCRDVPLKRAISPHHFLDWTVGDRLYFKVVGNDSIYTVPSAGGAPRAVLAGRWLRRRPDRDGLYYTIDRRLRYVALDEDGLPAGDHALIADRLQPFPTPFSVAAGGRRFVYDNVGLNEVWLGRRASPDSGDEFHWAQLVRESLSTSAARFSPDGTRIALAGRPIEERGQILLVHSLVDGTRTVVARGDGITSPDWSPDGTELVYRHGRGMSRIRLDGGIPRPIPGPREPMYVHWLPDGRIVYMERDGDMGHAYSAIDTTDGSIVHLPIDPERGTMFQFAVAPDAKSVAVAGNRGGRYEVKPWLIDLSDGTERLLYDGHAAPFAWSADGAWVYLLSDAPQESSSIRCSRILRVAVEGGAVETVTDLPEPAAGWSNIDLSPDETGLLYTQSRIGRDLWLMDIEPIHD